MVMGLAMRMRWLLVPTMVVGLIFVPRDGASAAEPVQEFLDGLRQRQYFDWAMLYLEQLQDQPDLPQDIRAILPFQRAMTLSESARHSVSPETQQRQLDQALEFLEQFTRESPRHPFAASANSTRANIQLNKARVELAQSRLPSNKENRGEYQDRAREWISQAGDIFQKAHDGYKAAWEAFPKFIDKIAEPARHGARQKAEVAYMRAQLDVALCQFEEAQTYDKGSTNHQFHAKKAVELFRGIFTKYRATVGGLHAQMWEAKCYEELDDPQRALGIYAELLTHPPDGLRPLQDQVRHFKMICLNHDRRREYALAIADADEWLAKAKPIEQRSQAGQGIRWELVVAQEKLADTSGTSPLEREKLLRLAITHLKSLTKWPGPYRDLAQQRIRDLSLRQRGKDGSDDPRDFDTSLALGRDLMKRVGEKKTLLDAAGNDKRPRKEVDKLRADYQQLLKEQIRVLRLTLSLADRHAPRTEVNQTRYLLAYGYYLADKPYEAAIAAESVAFSPTKDKHDEQAALDAAYLGLAAYIKAFNQVPTEHKPQREVDVQLMVRLAEFISTKWPSHGTANAARMLMGRTFSQTDQPRRAVEWFLKVPETADIFPEAQSAAGQALWQQFLMASLNEDITQRAALDELTKWRTDAEKFLKAGVERTQKKLPEGGKTPDELVAAKTALAEILLTSGQYQPAIDMLDKLPHSVLVAVSVDDQTRRPQHPNIRSARFASHVFQLLLRGRVGLQQLDAAREVMANLEQLAEHSGGADAVTAVYVQLGRELEKELNRLKGIGDTQRFNEVRRSFETFLDDMYKRADQNFSSLTWIAETYYGLAQSTLDNARESTTYFERAAATYQSILAHAIKDKEFADKDRLAGIRLRLINCLRRQKNYDQAESLIKTLLAERPKATDVQFEAAYLWQDQGLTGKSEFLKKALQGGTLDRDKVQVWGWTDLSMRLQRLLSDGRHETKERYGDKLFEAWYNTALCRQKFGLTQSTTSKKHAELETAKQVIQTFVRITVDFPDDWWKKFDRLYQQIQTDLNQSPTPLERPQEIVIVATSPRTTESAASPDAKSADKLKTTSKVTATVPQTTVAPKTVAPKTVAQKSDGGSGFAYAVFGLFVLAGGGAVVWLVMNSQSRRRRVIGGESDDAAPILVANAEFVTPSAATGPVYEMPEFRTPRKPATSSSTKASTTGKPVPNQPEKMPKGKTRKD